MFRAANVAGSICHGLPKDGELTKKVIGGFSIQQSIVVKGIKVSSYEALLEHVCMEESALDQKMPLSENFPYHWNKGDRM